MKKHFNLLLLGLVLLGISCTQAKLEAKCSRLKFDECRRESSDCFPVFANQCSGCDTKSCIGNGATQKCEIQIKCPENNNLINDGIIADLKRYPWIAEGATEHIRQFSGRAVTMAEFKLLDEKDRQFLCGKSPACVLVYQGEKLICEANKKYCEACKYEMKDYKCQAVNKCNGVICF